MCDEEDLQQCDGAEGLKEGHPHLDFLCLLWTRPSSSSRFRNSTASCRGWTGALAARSDSFTVHHKETDTDADLLIHLLVFCFTLLTSTKDLTNIFFL